MNEPHNDNLYLEVTRYTHKRPGRPSAGVTISTNYPNEKSKILFTCIAAYNEEREDLKRTLDSLSKQNADLEKLDFHHHAIILLDGWEKASSSMKEFLAELFPFEYWHLIQPPNNDSLPETWVFNYVSIQDTGRVTSWHPFHHANFPQLTLVVKRDNRQKRNSHDLFFHFAKNLYVQRYDLDVFPFCTDCGTIFEKKCLYRLLKHLMSDPTLSAATGRQRVMDKEQQGSDEDWWTWQAFLRCIQRYDYEASLASFMGAFALTGMLPVIPGPCGLFRGKHLFEGKPSPMEFYMDQVHIDADKLNLINGNLLLAEDRILSYSVVFNTATKCYARWVPEAIFYFEAETDGASLLPQRRRWTNGSVAGYIWLLQSGIIRKSQHKLITKFFMYLLIFFQLLVYLVVAISPAIFTVTFEQAIPVLFPTAIEVFPEFRTIVEMAYVALYFLLLLFHSFPQLEQAYSAWIFTVGTIANALVMVFSLSALVKSVSWDDWGADVLRFPYFEMRSTWLVFIMVVQLAMPFVLSLLTLDFKSPFLMISSALSFYLYLPTMVSWWNAYAFCRLWDLTWGNRPSSTLASAKDSKKRITQVGQSITAIIVFMNGLIAICLIWEYLNWLFLLILALFVFGFAGFLMCLSLIYLVFVRPIEWLKAHTTLFRRHEEMTRLT